MREPPPAQLISLLTRLGLATEKDFAGVDAVVHRMAGDLPKFESIWIDALRQARVLTHFQAAEIHAGRGETIAVARYVLCHCVHECGYSAVYRAEDRQSGDQVRLALFSSSNLEETALLTQLDQLVAGGRKLPRTIGLIDAAGVEDGLYWAASPWAAGTSLADLVLHHGRFPPEVVLEITRATLGELAVMEAGGLVHGDIRMQTVLVTNEGEVCIPHPGLRGIIRPCEGIARHDLAADACSALAPERVSQNTPPTVASDLFACGCVWWHLLCGRPPLGGGDTLARLCAAQAAAIDDLHQWATDVPDLLAAAINDCLQKDPQRRPRSIADLVQRLGSLRRQGRLAVARSLAAAVQPRAPWLGSRRRTGKKPARPHRLTIAALAAFAAVAVAWPLWVARNRPPNNTTIARHGDSERAKPRVTAKAPSTSAKRIAGSSVDGIERHRLPVDSRTPHEASPQPMVDTAVMPAAYGDATTASLALRLGATPDIPSQEKHEELLLPADRPVRGDSLHFKTRQRIVAQGRRGMIVVPRSGLAVQVERLSFENVDFVSEDRVERQAVHDEGPVLVRLSANECQFVGCSFQSERGNPELSSAILWQRIRSEPTAATLPSGRICLKNCVFRRVAAAIESRLPGAVGIEITNTLHLGPGPMIRLAHAPASDEPLHITLRQVTLRDAESLFDCRGILPGNACGEIAVEATGCVLAPRAQTALLAIFADEFPAQLLHEVKWSGQGSVIAGRTVFAQWCRRDDTRQTIDDATISIAGLVRGEVEFAAGADGDPGSSQVVNCQAPLQGSESAGAATRILPPEVR